jgi:hypothetical protein
MFQNKKMLQPSSSVCLGSRTANHKAATNIAVMFQISQGSNKYG